MHRGTNPRTIVSALAAIAGLASVLATQACNGGSQAGSDVTSASTGQALQKRSDGGSTCDGGTCSWDGTIYAGDATKEGNASYPVGASFKSPDACNDCECTAQGIMCTVRACNIACPAIAKACPDGTYVSPTGPNCEIPACPPPVGCGVCPPDAPCAACPPPPICGGPSITCPDGSIHSPEGPNCAITPCDPPPPPPPVCGGPSITCPDGSVHSPEGPNCAIAPCGPIACPAIAKLCPDGSSVGPEGPDCIIPDCPPACAPSECGPPPPIAYVKCQDGTAAELPCVRQDTGKCGWGGLTCGPVGFAE